MKKSKIDKQAVKIAKDLLFKLRTRKAVSSWHIDGYYQALCDFVLAYSGEDLRDRYFDAFYEKEAKFQEVKK